MKIVFTGGHHNSALEVARKILEQKPETEILWLGHKHTMLGDKSLSAEYKEVTSYGIKFKDLKAGKVYKTYKLMHWLRLPYGFFQAFFYLVQFRPKLIVSFGGYLAVPVVLAGWILRIPSVTHEQTSVTGLANNLIAKFADKIFITWHSSAKFFDKKKVIFTGLPLRESLLNPKNITNNFDFKNDLPIVYITGGKQGSHILNMAIKEKLSEILKFTNVIHQIGSSSLTDDYASLVALRGQLLDNLKEKYVPKEYVFENEIGEVFKKADVVISRSGAHTAYELLALGKPAILIPISWVSYGEQMENAKKLEEVGLAKVMDEKNITGDSLLIEIKSMVSNLSIYKKAGEEAKKQVTLDATERIVNEILKYEN